MNHKKESAISRREFARRTALVSVASLVPACNLPAPPCDVVPPPAQDQSALPAESQAEAEARFQAIAATYSARFSEEQKKDLRRLSLSVQPSLDRLRAFAIQNSDAPGLYLKPLVERERKVKAKTPATASGSAVKKH